jgi:hypothetical protein
VAVAEMVMMVRSDRAAAGEEEAERRGGGRHGMGALGRRQSAVFDYYGVVLP